MGERGVRNAEVTGSIPVPSTRPGPERKPECLERLGANASRSAVTALLVVACLSAGLAPARPEGRILQEGAPPDPARESELRALIERIELYHRSLPHFEARFEQHFMPRIFGRQRTESGMLIVKRPGRMRWEYQSPEPKVFVSDGTNTWFHVPADRQVIVGAFRSPDEVSGAGESRELPGPVAGEINPLAFLTGDLELLDHFDAMMADEAPDGLRSLRLTPRRSAAVSFVALLVNPETGLIRGIESEDPEGNRTAFRFDDFRYGAPPENSLFVFRIPPGTEIVTASELRQ